jgi:DNA-binding NarL/FixJ family response regulator
MAGGVLIVSRAVNLFSYWKGELEAAGFKDVRFTDKEKDGLNFVIREYKPKTVLIGCGFYSKATAYLMTELLEIFPNLNIAAVNIHECSDERGMSFISNGCKSYVNVMEGMDEFRCGMKAVMGGKNYISPGVQKKIKTLRGGLVPAHTVTDRQKEIIRHCCCGYTDNKIADILHISRRTVTTHKADIYRSLNVSNIIELYHVAAELGITTHGECCCC